MKKITINECIHISSGDFLTENIPLEYINDPNNEEKVIEWVRDYKWEQVANMEALDIVDLIETSARGWFRELSKRGLTQGDK